MKNHIAFRWIPALLLVFIFPGISGINAERNDDLNFRLHSPDSLIADFVSDFRVVKTGTKVRFYDHSQGGPMMYIWCFTGGFPDMCNDRNPCVTYSHPGCYPVTLTIYRGGYFNMLVRECFITVRDTIYPPLGPAVEGPFWDTNLDVPGGVLPVKYPRIPSGLKIPKK